MTKSSFFELERSSSGFSHSKSNIELNPKSLDFLRDQLLFKILFREWKEVKIKIHSIVLRNMSFNININWSFYMFWCLMFFHFQEHFRKKKNVWPFCILRFIVIKCCYNLNKIIFTVPWIQKKPKNHFTDHHAFVIVNYKLNFI